MKASTKVKDNYVQYEDGGKEANLQLTVNSEDVLFEDETSDGNHSHDTSKYVNFSDDISLNGDHDLNTTTHSSSNSCGSTVDESVPDEVSEDDRDSIETSATEGVEDSSSSAAVLSGAEDDQVHGEEMVIADWATHGLTVTGVEQWLCVSRLPADLTEVEFYDMLAEFGAVKHYFLVVSEETGNDSHFYSNFAIKYIEPISY